MATIIIGVGNPVRTDDGVGLRVARELSQILAADASVATAELHCGGMQLMEAMAGYDRAFVIDAMRGGGAPGTVRAFDPDELPNTRTTNSTHDGNLQAALEFGRAVGLRVPGWIRIWAVEAGDVETLSETLTPSVEHAVPGVVQEVLRELGAERQDVRSA
jgi:hydrogenase maturation protease